MQESKKFYASSFSNKLTLATAVLMWLAGILFVFSDETSLSVGAIWISGGTIWFLRYGWQIKNPALEITEKEVIVFAPLPWFCKRIAIVDVEKIIKKTDFKIVLGLRDSKKLRLALSQIEKGKRQELVFFLEEIVGKNREDVEIEKV